MKKVMMSLILSMLVAVSSFANNAEVVTKATTGMQNSQESKVKITMDDVPEVVKNALAESDYEAESVIEVYKLVLSDVLHYEFIIEIDSKKWAIYYDLEGKFAGKKEVE